MFKIHFGKEMHELTDEDFDYLAKHTEGFSGSDISNLVTQALLSPLQKLQKAEYFYLGKDGIYYPCAATSAGAIRVSLFDLPQGKVTNPIFKRVGEEARVEA